MKALSHTVSGYGGVKLHVREAGNPDGPPLLLIHGWSQHHLSWSKQFKGMLAERFRLIAPDLRGHGASDKPEGAHHYDCAAPWADDMRAVIRDLSLENPLLVGWSMGGWVAMDYLSIHGDADIAGIALIGTSVMAPGSPEVLAERSPAVKAEGMYSANQEVALTSTIAFLKACFAAPLSKQDLALMTGFNMLVPPAIRKASRLRQTDSEAALLATDRPVAVFWGEAEKVCSRTMFDATTAALPEATTFTYPGAGHAPFWERPDAFDTDLASFADAAFADSVDRVSA